MSVTCRDLLDMDIFQKIRLVAGERRLDNIISWPYIKQTNSLATWIYGGELIFESGVPGEDPSDQLAFLIKECVAYKVSGLVILCGDQSINEIPKEIVEEADRYGLPLFEMPYELRLIDVTKEISNAIVMGEFKKRTVSNYMSELLFGDFLSEDQLIKEGRRCKIDLNRGSFFAVFTSDYDEEEDDNYSGVMMYRNRMQAIMQKVEQICNRYGAVCSNCFSTDLFICLISLDDNEVREKICAKIDIFLQEYYTMKEVKIYAGYSCLHHGYKHIHKGYSECKQALQLARHNTEVEIYSCRYEEMGIMKFLIKTNEKEELISYCNEVLRSLKEMDRKEATDYVLTVYEYLKNNNNLIKTSQVLYIHRNTLVNRLSKIQAITGKDLNSVKVKMEYMNAFSILEFYNMI